MKKDVGEMKSRRIESPDLIVHPVRKRGKSELTPKIWTGVNGALSRIFSTGGLWYNATCYEETRSGIQG